MSDSILKAIEVQSQACASLGAPFSAGLLDCAKTDLASGGITSELLDPWTGAPIEGIVRDAVALRLLASLHYLVLSGRAPELAVRYPPNGIDPDDAWSTARIAFATNRKTVADFLTHEPQTNEVRRAACMLGGFMTIAHATRFPLRCFELGASAGLNSLWDKFLYRIDEQAWGNPNSAVVLSCRWTGTAPRLDPTLAVAERRACDRKPVDIRQPDQAIRLMSYCWAEQHERIERLRSAIALATDFRMEVDAQEASQWVAQAAPEKGMSTTVFHSLVWQYMPPHEQAEVSAILLSHASRATPSAPFAWLRMELEEAAKQFQLRLTMWPSGEERLLAVVHPHGEFAVWS